MKHLKRFNEEFKKGDKVLDDRDGKVGDYQKNHTNGNGDEYVVMMRGGKYLDIPVKHAVPFSDEALQKARKNRKGRLID